MSLLWLTFCLYFYKSRDFHERGFRHQGNVKKRVQDVSGQVVSDNNKVSFAFFFVSDSTEQYGSGEGETRVQFGDGQNRSICSKCLPGRHCPKSVPSKRGASSFFIIKGTGNVKFHCRNARVHQPIRTKLQWFGWIGDAGQRKETSPGDYFEGIREEEQMAGGKNGRGNNVLLE